MKQSTELCNIRKHKLWLTLILTMMLAGAVNAQQRTLQQEEPDYDYPAVKVSLGEFEVLGVSEKDQLLGQKIREAIAAGFMTVQQIAYIDVTMPVQQASTLRSGQSKAPDYKTFRDREIQFYITGTVTIYQRELNIDVNIRDIENEESTPLSSGYKKTSQLYLVIDEITKRITTHIIEHALMGEVMNIGLLCFEPESGTTGNTEIAEFYASDLPRSIYYNFDSGMDKYVMPPEQFTAPCREHSDVAALLNETKTDLLISGTISPGTGRRFVVTPRIYVRGLDHGIDLFPIEGERNEYDQFELKLAMEIGSFIDGIVDDNGEFITGPFNTPNPTVDDYWDQGEILFDNQNYFLAEFFFKKVVELDPTDYSAQYNIGYAREVSRNYEGALSAYDKALAINPDYQLAKVGKAYVLTAQGKYRDALEQYQSIQEAAPEYSYIHYYLGRSYYYLNEFENALKELNYSAENEDPYYDTYYLLGRIYYENEEFDKSLQAFKKGLELVELSDPKPDDSNLRWYIADIYQDRGVELYTAGNYENAYQNFILAKSYKEDEYLFNYLRFTLNRMLDLESADAVILEGVRKGLYREDEVHYNQATDLRFLYFSDTAPNSEKYLIAAISNLKKHLQAVPNDWQAAYMIGNSYSTLGNTSESLKYLEKAYQGNPVDNTTILDLAEILIIEGQADRVHSTLGNLVIHGDGSGDEKSTELLSSYLKIVADKILRNPTSEDEKKLNESLTRGDKVYNWSYNTFRNWITEKARVRRKVRSEILALTDLMESHTQSN